MDFSDYSRVIWFVIVTMATVGYGDITPKTIPGRIFAFLLAIWGVFLISMVVLLFFNFMQLTDSESMALKVYDRMVFRDAMIKDAALVLGKITRIRKYYKLNKKSKVKSLAAGFKQAIANFREKSM